MSVLDRTTRSAVRVRPWQLALSQVLEEHHVCAYSDSLTARTSFTVDLVLQLALMDNSQVCVVDGSLTHDVPSFGRELGAALGVESGRHALDTVADIVWAMRRRFPRADQPTVKRRFIVWTEAHDLLRRDASAFSQIADAIMGVAAESEFTSEDLLLLQRVVFVGRTSLDLYGEEATGQFREWIQEGDERPLWSVVSGQEAPRVCRLAIKTDGSVVLPEGAQT